MRVLVVYIHIITSHFSHFHHLINTENTNCMVCADLHIFLVYFCNDFSLSSILIMICLDHMKPQVAQQSSTNGIVEYPYKVTAKHREVSLV